MINSCISCFTGDKYHTLCFILNAVYLDLYQKSKLTQVNTKLKPEN